MNQEGLEEERLDKPSARPVSPCVRLCHIEAESQLCQGCARSLDEIARWTTMSESEKASVWQRLRSLSPIGNNRGMLVVLSNDT